MTRKVSHISAYADLW